MKLIALVVAAIATASVAGSEERGLIAFNHQSCAILAIGPARYVSQENRLMRGPLIAKVKRELAGDTRYEMLIGQNSSPQTINDFGEVHVCASKRLRRTDAQPLEIVCYVDGKKKLVSTAYLPTRAMSNELRAFSCGRHCGEAPFRTIYELSLEEDQRLAPGHEKALARFFRQCDGKSKS